MDINDIRKDISYRRHMIGRQQKEILDLQRLGIPTTGAEALLVRMQAKVDDLCEERDRLKGLKDKKTYPGTTKVIRGTQRRGL